MDIPKFCLGFYEASDLILPLPPTAGVDRRKVSWDYGLFNLMQSTPATSPSLLATQKRGAIIRNLCSAKKKSNYNDFCMHLNIDAFPTGVWKLISISINIS